MIKKIFNMVLSGIGVQITLMKPKNTFTDSILDQFPKELHPLIIDSKILIKNLLSIPDTKLWFENNQLFFKVQGIIIEVETHEDFFILNEVFYEGDYNIAFPKEYVLIDIGMNVGITSLFFANKPEVIKVIAYEPVKDTFDQALNNFNLNKSFSGKITPNLYGLSDQNNTINLDYTYQWKGSVGINKLSDSKIKSSKLKTISVQLIDVSCEIQKIKVDFPTIPIIVKIDCEGSEYSIIDRLAEKKLIKEISIFMIEWHSKGPNRLRSTLNQHGYLCFSRTPYSKSIGMLYAIKGTTE